MLFPCRLRQKSGDHLAPRGARSHSRVLTKLTPERQGSRFWHRPGEPPLPLDGLRTAPGVQAELELRVPATFSRPLPSRPHELPSDGPFPGCGSP